jgi:lipopolysaccharide heptosyltransferase I
MLAELRTLSPQRVCLIKPSAVGDIVNALPVLSALRQRWPEAWIAWVVNQSFRGLLDGHPALDEVIAYDRRGAKLTPAGVARLSGFLQQLASGRFDLAVDLQGLLRSGIMALATGARVRVGLSDAREGAARFYTHQVPSPGARGTVHAVDRLLRLAEVFGADVRKPRFVVPCAAEDRAWAREAVRDVPRPRLMLNLGASWKTKRWPPHQFAVIARRAHEARRAGLIAIGSAEDSPRVAELRGCLDPIAVLDLCGRTTLRQVAALALESDLVLSNDSGPLHLARAAGARVVGLYTCTSPQLHGPYGRDAVTIQSNIWCAGSYVKTCARLDCMQELTPDRVWPSVLSQLDAALLRHSSPSGHQAGSR